MHSWSVQIYRRWPPSLRLVDGDEKLGGSVTQERTIRARLRGGLELDNSDQDGSTPGSLVRRHPFICIGSSSYRVRRLIPYRLTATMPCVWDKGKSLTASLNEPQGGVEIPHISMYQTSRLTIYTHTPLSLCHDLLWRGVHYHTASIRLRTRSASTMPSSSPRTVPRTSSRTTGRRCVSSRPS